MPYKIEKSHNGCFVVNMRTGEKMSKKPLTYSQCKKQKYAIEISEHNKKMKNFKDKYKGIFF